MQQETINNNSILLKVYFHPGDIVRKIRVPITTTFSEFSDQIRQLVEEQEISMWSKGTSTKLSCCVCGDNQETEWFNLSNEHQWRNVIDVTRLLNETRLVAAQQTVAVDKNYPDESAERFLRVRAVGVLGRVVPLSASHYFAPLMGNLHRMRASWSEKLQPLLTGTSSTGSNALNSDDHQEGKFVLLADLDPTFFVPLDNDVETLSNEQQQEENVDNIVMNVDESHDTDCCSTQLSSYSTCTPVFETQVEFYDDVSSQNTPSQEMIDDDDDDEEEEQQQVLQQQEPFQYDKELELLEQMGIPDSESVRQLLIENNGNLPRVVSAYLEVSFNVNM